MSGRRLDQIGEGFGVEPDRALNGGFSTDANDPEQVQALARRIIRPLRERARAMGYALALHGSLARDIDVVAVPWTEAAVAPDALANALRHEIERLYPIGLEHGPSEKHPKPHGRLCWSFWLRPWTYIDLSVMPPSTGGEA